MQRRLKVYTAPGKFPEVPEIRLQGEWLRNEGFEKGDCILVTIEDGKITIEHTVEEEELKIEEFMLSESDTRKLMECLKIYNEELSKRNQMTPQEYAEKLFRDSLDRWWKMMTAK